MDYNEALQYIHGASKFGWKLGLNNITRLLDLMGNPHKKLKFIHVAGTNGKGSVCAFLTQILIEAGYRVGTFTSPYIERFTERIKLDNCDIDEDDLARITGFVKSRVDMMTQAGENHPTEFEIVTAIGMQYFFEKKCDVVVLEVGLGGRFDATNVIDVPLAAVIMTIGYDHTDILGKTLPEIAFEKAGIIKEGGDVLLYPQSDEAEKVFERVCAERKAVLHKVDTGCIKIREFSEDGQVFDYGERKGLSIHLLGEHQAKNAAMAIRTVELLAKKGLPVTEEQLRRGLEKTRWPGRLEVLLKKPVFLIDGAHNREGAEVLSRTLREYFPNHRKIFIFGVLKDKEYDLMLEKVAPLASAIITVTPESPRAMKARDLAVIAGRYCKNVLVSDTIEDAIEKSFKLAEPDDLVCSFGSLYYIGVVRQLLLNRKK